MRRFRHAHELRCFRRNDAGMSAGVPVLVPEIGPRSDDFTVLQPVPERGAVGCGTSVRDPRDRKSAVPRAEFAAYAPCPPISSADRRSSSVRPGIPPVQHAGRAAVPVRESRRERPGPGEHAQTMLSWRARQWWQLERTARREAIPAPSFSVPSGAERATQVRCNDRL
jgi:hypothetical protein